uniref:Uncharacterized protein n=1 Tax=Coccolithus braarudii TaxID=221442 RepID=A0A7S0Q447_9EUKA|mmetsp:Transcript_4581/g.9947  ORF Transcript_4581/g.9947 Transcript_4581/m.9947 type:complete len:173 (+) Transcript_4581:130-648(+)
MSSLTLAQQAFCSWQKSVAAAAINSSIPEASRAEAATPFEPNTSDLDHSAHLQRATAAADATRYHWIWPDIPPPLPLQRSPALSPDSDIDALLALICRTPEMITAKKARDRHVWQTVDCSAEYWSAAIPSGAIAADTEDEVSSMLNGMQDCQDRRARSFEVEPYDLAVSLEM